MNKVLWLYKSIPAIHYPISPQSFISLNKSCKIMSYNKLARINNCTIQDIIVANGSSTGCTHYDRLNDRYLIMVNTSPDNNNVIGRMRWTASHELGHVTLEHFKRFNYMDSLLAENEIISYIDYDIEAEANLFAAVFLCPFPICNYLKISSADDIFRTFGLSHEASYNQWSDYLRWSKYHKETNWDRQIVELYRRKSIQPHVV